VPTDEFPFWLTTGRTLYHFHTRTKTGRTPQLQAAAPEVWVELSPGDARRIEVSEGDRVEVSTPRGSMQARVRVTGIRDGVLFVPFHYGYWDSGGDGRERGPGTAANELTITEWDPVSKQPVFKTAAARLTLIARAGGQPSRAPTTTASRPVDAGVAPTTGGPSAFADEMTTETAG
jgi:anaerobic selenocysteine-containing dehydrogenase